MEAAKVKPESREQLAVLIDQTQLRLGVPVSETSAFVTRAVEWGFGGVCVLPNAVSLARRVAAGTRTKVVTVVSFPIGADVPDVKCAEACDALERGAEEIDMVIDVGAARAADAEAIAREVAAVREALPEGTVLKAIIEMPLLTDEQAILAAQAAERGGADFIKTSTGYKDLGIRATSARDVRLLRGVLRPETGIKAAGGISSWRQASVMLEAGAVRIGTSSGVAIVEEFLKARRTAA
jgi:deoxyribose-phosphate aldolase